MFGKDAPDFLVEERDVFAQGFELIQQQAQLPHGDVEHHGIAGEQFGFGNQVQPLLHPFGPADIVGVVEVSDGGGPGVFEAQQIGPAAQEGDGQFGVEVLQQLEGLRIIAFEQAGQLVEHLGAAIHRVAPGLDQGVELAGVFVLGFQRAKLGGVIAMFGAIVVLFLIPWLDTSRVRSTSYRPIYRWFFWAFVFDALALGYIGSQKAEGSWVFWGQVFTVYYFAHFLLVMPLVGLIETPSPMPESIADDFKHKAKPEQVQPVPAA